MPQAAKPINNQSTAVGLTLRKVVVQQMVPERGIAVVSDKMNFLAQVPYRAQQGGARLPREGDVWLIDRTTGAWNFGRYLAKSDADLATLPGPVTIDGDLSVDGDLAIDGTTFMDGTLEVGGNTTLHGSTLSYGVVTTNSSFSVREGAAADFAYSARAAGDDYPRFVVRRSGAIGWSAGDFLTDAEIWREDYYALKTNGTWDATNFPSGEWTYLYPSWTTSSGINIPSFGNANIQLWWTRTGRLITCQFNFTFGTTTSYGGGTFSDNWRFGIPVQAAQTQDCVGFADAQSSTNHRVTCRVAMLTVNSFSLDVCSPAVDQVALANTGVVDAVTPWTWASNTNHIIRGSFSYQAYNATGF